MPFVGFAAGLAAPELGPPGGSRFGPAFIFGDCPSQVFGIAMSGAAPFWGPPGGPRNGSVRTKYVYGWGRQAAPVLSSFFGPRIFQAFFCIAVSGAGPFWGPSGGPRIGSADTNSIVVGSPCDKLFDAFRSRNLCGCGAGRKMCKGRGLLECENVPALIFPFETNEIKTMRSTHALVVRMPFILLPSQSRMVGNWQCEFVYGVMDVLNRCVCQMPLDFWVLFRKQCKNCCALRAPGHFL